MIIAAVLPALLSFLLTNYFSTKNTVSIEKYSKIESRYEDISAQYQELQLLYDNRNNTENAPNLYNNELDALKMDYDTLISEHAQLQERYNNLLMGKEQSTDSPGAIQYMTDILPAYQNSNTYKYKEYSALKTGGTENFSMAGVKYLNGFTINDYANWAVWNLNGQYTNFTGTFGHVDETSIDVDVDNDFRILYVYCDDVLKQETSFVSDMIPTKISINVTGVSQLKILLGAKTHAGVSPVYGFGDPVLS